MNANELADELEDLGKFFEDRLYTKAATMLRQQQTELEELKSQSNPYKAITDTKIEATAVSYNPLTKAQEDSIWVEAYQAGFEAGKAKMLNNGDH